MSRHRGGRQISTAKAAGIIILIGIIGLIGMVHKAHKARPVPTAHLGIIVTPRPAGGSPWSLALGLLAVGVAAASVLMFVLIRRMGPPPKAIALPAAPRRELPAPLHVPELEATPLHAFAEIPPPPASGPAPTGGNGSCEGPGCREDLPDDPWEAGASPVVPTGEEDRPRESHKFCSRKCVDAWITAQMEQMAAAGRGKR